MTKNSYSKSAIRERMAKTGESYSVAARAIANSPIELGLPVIDRRMGGGLPLGSMSYFAFIEPTTRDLMAEPNTALILSNLTAPDRRALVVSTETQEELHDTIARFYGSDKKRARHTTNRLKLYDGRWTPADLERSLRSDPELSTVVIDLLAWLEAIRLAPGAKRGKTLSSDLAEIKRIAAELKVTVVLLNKSRLRFREGRGYISVPYSAATVELSDFVIVSKEIDGTAYSALLKTREGASWSIADNDPEAEVLNPLENLFRDSVEVDEVFIGLLFGLPQDALQAALDLPAPEPSAD